MHHVCDAFSHSKFATYLDTTTCMWKTAKVEMICLAQSVLSLRDASAQKG